MGLTRKDVLKLIGVGAGAAAAGRMGLGAVLPPAEISADSVAADAIITRDVVVIGGGATGTYAAIRLRDLGKSVVVVETNDRLGGHTTPTPTRRPAAGSTSRHRLARPADRAPVVRPFRGAAGEGRLRHPRHAVAGG